MNARKLIAGSALAALAAVRSRDIGMVFQDGELLPELTPVDNVALAGLLAGLGAKEAVERARTLLSELDVTTAAETHRRAFGR